MSLPAPPKHLIAMNTKIFNENFAVAGAAMHCFHFAYFGPSLVWEVDDECSSTQISKNAESEISNIVADVAE